MAYTKPIEVISPKTKWTIHEVLADTGKNGWSIAKGEWAKEQTLAIRWNGADGDLGNPQSRGHPTWFILPRELDDVMHGAIKMLEKNRDDVHCEISPHENENNGVWNVLLTISKAVQDEWATKLPFSLPHLESRLFRPEEKYVCPTEQGLKVCFIEGIFESFLYSNGCAEKDNPVDIQTVEDALLRAVNAVIMKNRLR